MFDVSKFYVAAAGGIGALLLAALLVFAGYRVGVRFERGDWERLERDRAEAIVGLAERHAQADAEAKQLRTASEGVAAKRVVEIRHEIVKIPVRVGCGHSTDEYRLLLDTFCARNATDPQCLRRSVPDIGSTDPGAGQPGTDGSGDQAPL